jgi:surfactin synthase thioesterase subunit
VLIYFSYSTAEMGCQMLRLAGPGRGDERHNPLKQALSPLAEGAIMEKKEAVDEWGIAP